MHSLKLWLTWWYVLFSSSWKWDAKRKFREAPMTTNYISVSVISWRKLYIAWGSCLHEQLRPNTDVNPRRWQELLSSFLPSYIYYIYCLGVMLVKQLRPYTDVYLRRWQSSYVCFCRPVWKTLQDPGNKYRPTVKFHMHSSLGCGRRGALQSSKNKQCK